MIKPPFKLSMLLNKTRLNSFATKTKTYYELLAVDQSASSIEIKKAFNKLVKQNHPDLKGKDRKTEDEFKNIVSAYQHLKDPVKRKIYDNNLKYQHLDESNLDGNDIIIDSSEFYKNRWYDYKEPQNDLRQQYDILNNQKSFFESFMEKSRNKFLIVFLLLGIYEAFSLYRRNKYKQFREFQKVLEKPETTTDIYNYIEYREIKNNFETESD